MILLLIVGQVNLPSNALEEWKKLRLDSAKFEDWPDGAPVFTGKSPRTFATVRDVLDAAAALSGSPDFFEFDGETVRGLLTPHSTNALHQDLATAFRLLSKFAATGQIYFFVPQEGVTFLVNIGDPHAACDHDHDGDHDHPAVDWVDPNEVLNHDEQASLGFVRISEFLKAWAENKSLTRKAFLLQRAGLGLLPLAEQPHHQELLTLLGSLDVKQLHSTMVIEELADGDQVKLAKFFPTADALNVALLEAHPKARAAAIELLSILKPGVAEERVAPFLEDPSSEVRRHALSALGRAGTDSALSRLLALKLRDDEDAELVEAHLQAVSACKAPNATKLAAAQLAAPSLSVEVWQNVERATLPRAALAASSNRAVSLAATHSNDQTIDRLFGLFDTHPAEEVRVAAARALAQVGGLAVDKRVMAINCALLGMGKALNQDDGRRKALLHISNNDYSDGLIRFSDIDHTTLTALLRENFANPGNAQNDAPSTGTFAEILAEYPNLRVGGYLVAPARDDYRVSLDSITCPSVKAIPEGHRQAVMELFESFSESATNTDAEPGSLHCWWT